MSARIERASSLPWMRADGVHGALDGLGGVAQRVADQVVDEVDDQHAEDDGELVARDERAADAGGRDLGDVHRADSRGQTDADAAQDAVEVEDDEQRLRRFAVGQDAALGAPRAEGRDEEHDRCGDERTFAAQMRGHQARDRAADDAADQGARRRESVPPRGVEVAQTAAEEVFEGFFGSRHHGGVVTEE